MLFSCQKKNNNNIYSEYNQGSKSYLKLAEGTADGGPVKWHHEKSQRENTGHPVRQLAWTFQKINDVYIKKFFEMDRAILSRRLLKSSHSQLQYMKFDWIFGTSGEI